jgi:hypothetical protein
LGHLLLRSVFKIIGHQALSNAPTMSSATNGAKSFFLNEFLIKFIVFEIASIVDVCGVKPY